MGISFILADTGQDASDRDGSVTKPLSTQENARGRTFVTAGINVHDFSVQTVEDPTRLRTSGQWGRSLNVLTTFTSSLTDKENKFGRKEINKVVT